MTERHNDRDKYQSECRKCGGEGYIDGTKCSLCRGRGVVEYSNPKKGEESGGSYSKRIPGSENQDKDCYIREGKLKDHTWRGDEK